MPSPKRTHAGRGQLSTTRAVVFVAFLALLASLGWTPGSASAEGRELPADMLELMPANPVVLIVFSSAEQLQASLSALSESVEPESDPYEFLPGVMPALESVLDEVDPRRPIAITYSLPSQSSPMPPMAVFVPWRGERPAALEYIADPPYPGRADAGHYTAFSTDPGFEPGVPPQLMVEGLADAQLVARVDFEGIVEGFGAILDMMLTGLEGEDPSAQGLPKGLSDVPGEERTAYAGMARKLISSVKTVDLIADIRDGRHYLEGRFEVQPGSPFDMGVQPDFADAVALASYLPQDTSQFFVSALSTEQLYANVPELFAAYAESSARDMEEPVRSAFQSWVARAYELYLHVYERLATSMEIEADGMTSVVVMGATDPQDLLARFDAHLMALGETGVGARFVEGPKLELGSGVTASSYELEIDWDQLSLAMPDSLGMSDWDADDRNEFLETIEFFMPTLWMAAVDEALIMSTDSDGKLLTQAVTRIVEGEGALPPAVDRAVKRAEGTPTYLGQIELRSLLMATDDLMEQFAKAESAGEVEPGPPVEMTLVGWVDRNVGRYAWSVDLVELAAMLADLEAFESKHTHGDSSELSGEGSTGSSEGREDGGGWE